MEWLARLGSEYANLRAALAWSFGAFGDALVGCRLVGALTRYWRIVNLAYGEVRGWVTQATQAVTDDMPADVQAWVWLAADIFLGAVNPYSRRALALFEASGNRAGALVAKGYVGRTLFYEHHYAAALELNEESVAESRELGDRWVLRFNLDMLSDCLRYNRMTERADAVYQELLALDRADGDLLHAANVLLYYISGAAKERLQFRESLQYDEEALEIARTLGSAAFETRARYQIAENVRYLGDTPRAVALLEDCLAFARERLADSYLVNTYVYLGRAVNEQGDLVRAQVLLQEALRIDLSYGFLYRNYSIFDAMAVVAAGCGKAGRCARLRGAADSLMAERHHYRLANLEWEYAPYIAAARAALGDEAFEAAYSEGRAMTPEQAVEYALQTG